jgi:hypothetical protein
MMNWLFKLLNIKPKEKNREKAGLAGTVKNYVNLANAGCRIG